MHEAAAIPSWVLLAYLISGICFILALRGLSSPASSQRGNRAGMIGMAIAVVTTLYFHAPRIVLGTDEKQAAEAIGYIPPIDWVTFGQIAAAVAIGGGIRSDYCSPNCQ